MRTQLDMIFGAVAAVILDCAAIALVVALLLLDRRLGIRKGITLDTVFVVVVALSCAAWLAGHWFKRRLIRDISASINANEFNPAEARPGQELSLSECHSRLYR